MITKLQDNNLRQDNPTTDIAAAIAVMSAPSLQTLRATYRDLYRGSLRAVQYSVPARFCVREKLRTAFRLTPVTHFNPLRIKNTLDFLAIAAEKRGLEHTIVKNLCHVHPRL